VDRGHVVRARDQLQHLVHVHEPPVLSLGVEVLREEGDVLVVNKPCSLPVHPSGRYRRNTVLGVLAKERGMHGLFNVHRLDRVTSGVLMLAKHRTAALRLTQAFKEGRARKRYLARVRGRIPEREVEVRARIECESKTGAIWRVGGGGKEAVTVVRELVYDEELGSSLVLCEPKTGRTHQIRLHLKHLGTPIVDDPLYNPSPSPTHPPYRGAGLDPTLNLEANNWTEPWCPTCQEAAAASAAGYYMRQKQHNDESFCMGICLHALSLTLDAAALPHEATFAAPLPAWAAEMLGGDAEALLGV